MNFVMIRLLKLRTTMWTHPWSSFMTSWLATLIPATRSNQSLTLCSWLNQQQQGPQKSSAILIIKITRLIPILSLWDVITLWTSNPATVLKSLPYHRHGNSSSMMPTLILQSPLSAGSSWWNHTPEAKSLASSSLQSLSSLETSFASSPLRYMSTKKVISSAVRSTNQWKLWAIRRSHGGMVKRLCLS